MSKQRRNLAAPLAWMSIGVIGVFAFLNILSVGNKLRAHSKQHDYSYIDDDFPDYLLLTLNRARWVMQDTVHYDVNGIDAEAEWEATFPRGEGFVHLGSQRRRFGLSIFHQMHCLQMIRHALTSENIGHHTTHCLTYLRLMILCRADLQLEAASDTLHEGWMGVDWVKERECKDWGQLYEWAGRNYDSYEEWS